MSKKSSYIIGILALQGAFEEHADMVRELGCDVRFVREIKNTHGLSAFILPGGESTALMKLLKKTGLDEWLVTAAKKGLPIYGTCAGMIVLAKLGLIDIKVDRNAYGAQLSSFEVPIEFEGKEYPGVFIRAPKVVKVGDEVEVLAMEGDTPALLKQKNILVSSFHPELTEDCSIHAFFVNHI